VRHCGKQVYSPVFCEIRRARCKIFQTYLRRHCNYCLTSKQIAKYVCSNPAIAVSMLASTRCSPDAVHVYRRLPLMRGTSKHPSRPIPSLIMRPAMPLSRYICVIWPTLIDKHLAHICTYCLLLSLSFQCTMLHISLVQLRLVEITATTRLHIVFSSCVFQSD
jgi:hypothetical protein